MRRPDPTGPLCVRVLDLTSSISLVRASGETRRRVFDALKGAREACFLGEQFCWHPVLPDPAPPLRRALRLDAPVVCWVLDSTGHLVSCLSLCIDTQSEVCTARARLQGTCRVQNPDIPRAGRVGTHGGVTGRGRAGLGANRIVRPGNKPPSHPPKHRRHVSSSPQKHEQAKSYVNRWRNKTRG